MINSKEGFEKLFIYSAQGILVADKTGKIVRANPACENMFGYETGELPGKKVETLIPRRFEANHQKVRKEYNHHPHSRTMGIGMDLSGCRKDNTEFPVEVSLSPITTKEGSFVIAFIIDITERKKTEQALKEKTEEIKINEERYRSVTQSANDAIISSDSKGKIIDWNPGAEKIFGYTKKEAIGKELTMIIPNTYREQHARGMKYLELNSEHRVSGKTRELIGLHKSGKEFAIELSLAEWETSGGKYFTGIIRDITQRKKAEEELRESEEKYRTLVEVADDVILLTDLNGKHLFRNKAFYTSLGYEAGEPLDTNGFAPVHPDDKPKLMHLHKKLLEQGSLSSEYRVRNKQGNWVHRFAKSTVIRDKIGNPSQILAIIRDITERKNAEEALKENELKLQELNSTKDKFFSIIAHDLKNPFAATLSASKMLLSYIDKKDFTKVESIARMLYPATKQTYALLENLLEWSRSQRGAINFSPAFLHMKSTVIDSIEIAESQAKAKNITITNDVPDNFHIIADENLLSVVFRNLLSNAIKFTKDGGSVTIKACINGKMAEVSVIDTGIGIPKEHQDKLFRIDTKYQRIGTANEYGTSLGLILCKEFIEKHKGKIWVESEENKGSEFKFSIPDYH